MDRINKTKSAIDDMFATKTATFPASPDAQAEWNIKTMNGAITLSAAEIRNTLMWKENVIWINQMMAEGYNFIDIGKNYLADRRGIFYDMERTYLYFK